MNAVDKRIANLRAKMLQKNIEAVLVTKCNNYMYLSGFTGSSAVLVITANDEVLVTDFRYVEQAQKQAPSYRIVESKGSMFGALNEIFENTKIERLAFEDSHMTVASFNENKKKLRINKWVPLGGIFEELRRIKDSDEIEIIRKAVKIADDAFKYILDLIKPGVAEVELGAELEYFMKKQGASGVSFESIIASGVRASMPHGVASEKRIEYGDVVTMDFGALYEGYCSDMTRTVFLGKPKEELKKIYGIVLEAQKMGLENVISGRTGREIDFVVRQYIARAGFGDNFGHGLGHGVGLEIHEEPILSMSGEIKMEDGMVVTVEPGIYVNGLGGVRIEDMVVVRGSNPEILTTSVKDITVL